MEAQPHKVLAVYCETISLACSKSDSRNTQKKAQKSRALNFQLTFRLAAYSKYINSDRQYLQWQHVRKMGEKSQNIIQFFVLWIFKLSAHLITKMLQWWMLMNMLLWRTSYERSWKKVFYEVTQQMSQLWNKVIKWLVNWNALYSHISSCHPVPPQSLHYRRYKSNTVCVGKCRGALLASCDPTGEVSEEGSMTGLTVTDRETGKSVTIPLSAMETQTGRHSWSNQDNLLCLSQSSCFI